MRAFISRNENIYFPERAVSAGRGAANGATFPPTMLNLRGIISSVDTVIVAGDASRQAARRPETSRNRIKPPTRFVRRRGRLPVWSKAGGLVGGIPRTLYIVYSGWVRTGTIYIVGMGRMCDNALHRVSLQTNFQTDTLVSK